MSEKHLEASNVTNTKQRVLEQHGLPATALQSCYTHTHTHIHKYGTACRYIPHIAYW